MRVPLVALARLTGISRRYLSLAERGTANVTLDVVMVIAKALGKDPTEMLTPKPKAPSRRGRSKP
ncbi:MAG: helix-turn-helix transcriptional regulator [Alphaproteobacteria bacterium]|nr:helix-turn-helix transcriptional regulator [Alphaproteobacteria bacterium]